MAPDRRRSVAEAGPLTAGYTLLDTGHGARLEQAGPYRLVRPALQALWRPSLPASEWDTAVACFRRSPAGGGTWSYSRQLPESWTLAYDQLTLKIKLTDFGHLGFFAEHGAQWQWVAERIQAAGHPVRLLNAFAYTGGMTLAAARAGANVVHLDAADSIVAWARENASLSGLHEAPIRWVVEDVTKFLSREVRRGHTYDALILDPPSFGRGSKGEVWKLERDLPGLLDLCRQLLSRTPLFVLLSAHTPGVTPSVLENLLLDMFESGQGLITGMEMTVPQGQGTRLFPSGALARWSRD